VQITDQQAKIIGQEIGKAIAAELRAFFNPASGPTPMQTLRTEMQHGFTKIAKAVKPEQP
jgi:hypothetical protein